jgi:hypothetical protein
MNTNPEMLEQIKDKYNDIGSDYNMLTFLLAVYHFVVLHGYEDIKTYLSEDICYKPSVFEECWAAMADDRYLRTYIEYLKLEYSNGAELNDVSCRFMSLQDITVSMLVKMLDITVDQAVEIKECDDIEEIYALYHIFNVSNGWHGLEHSTFELNGDTIQDQGIEYINTGDQYSCTLIYDKVDNGIYVTDWTSYIEYQNLKIECFKNNLPLRKIEENQAVTFKHFDFEVSFDMVCGEPTEIKEFTGLKSLEDNGHYDPNYSIDHQWNEIFRSLDDEYACQF